MRTALVIVGFIPVADPLRDIPGHVIKTVRTLAVFKRAHWR